MLRCRLTGLLTADPHKEHSGQVQAQVAAPTSDGSGIRLELVAVQAQAVATLASLHKGDGISVEGYLCQRAELTRKGGVRPYLQLVVDAMGEVVICEGQYLI